MHHERIFARIRRCTGPLYFRFLSALVPTEGITHQALVDGSDDRLDGGDLQEFSGLQVIHDHLAERGWRAHLAGNGHQDHIGPISVVAYGASDNRGFSSPLILLKLHRREVLVFIPKVGPAGR